MNNPLIIGLVAFAIILAGAFAGWKVRDHLPDHHLTDETKNLVSVSMTVVATISAGRVPLFRFARFVFEGV